MLFSWFLPGFGADSVQTWPSLRSSGEASRPKSRSARSTSRCLATRSTETGQQRHGKFTLKKPYQIGKNIWKKQYSYLCIYLSIYIFIDLLLLPLLLLLLLYHYHCHCQYRHDYHVLLLLLLALLLLLLYIYIHVIYIYILAKLKNSLPWICWKPHEELAGGRT